MFWKLLAAPRWIVVGSAALIVFVGYSLGFKLTKEQLSWTGALLIGAAGAVVVGLALAAGLTLRAREVRAVGADQLSPGQQAEAYRAAQLGQVHPDPDIRAAALRIADHRVKAGTRQRVLFVVAGVLVTASAVLNLLTGHVSSAVIGFVGVVALLVAIRQVTVARRRAVELVSASDET
jgi:hypothetical protein